MRGTPTPLAVAVDRDREEPLGVQLSAQVGGLVLAGTLARGDRLPSSRALAADLGVSRTVAKGAYEQLVAEGWLETRHGAGTFVASGGGVRRPPVRQGRARPRPAAGPSRRGHAVDRPPAVRGLAAGLARGVDGPAAAGLRRPARPAGAAHRLAGHLARTRGLVVDPEEVVVTLGTTDGLRHVLGALPPGPVAVEDPGYRAAVETVGALGRPVRDLPAATAVGSLAGLVAAYVTPAHQHPLGRVMPADDRLGLLAAARTAGAWVSRTTTTRSSATTSRRCPPGHAGPHPRRVPGHRVEGGRAEPAAGVAGAAARPARRGQPAAGGDPRGGAVAGAAGVPRAAARRLRRQGRPLRAPGVRRPVAAGGRRRWRRTPRRRARWPACTRPGCSPRSTPCGPGTRPGRRASR